jgi:hypothetical protein
MRHRTLRLVFGWRAPWSNIAPPVIAAVIALMPAIACRLLLKGVTGQIVAAVVFLVLFGLEWWWFHFQRMRVKR